MTTTRERTTTGAVSGGWRAVTEHLLRQYRRIWVGSAISSFLTPLLYLGGMGYGLGLLVDRNAGGIGGVSYLAFIAPGVLAGTALQVAAGESTFPVMAAMKWVPIYFGMLASPLGVRDLVRGHQTFVLVRVATTSAIFFGVAAASASKEAILVAGVAGIAVVMSCERIGRIRRRCGCSGHRTCRGVAGRRRKTITSANISRSCLRHYSLL